MTIHPSHLSMPDPATLRNRKFMWFILLALLSLPIMAAPPPSEMAWTKMGMELLGGLALFLFGMEQMADALKSVAGERMRHILGKLTSNRILGAATGAFVTAVIQSSSVTTVLLVGFISAGLMSLSQSVGVIMGANIGTTITAQIVAFKVTKLAYAMIALGYSMIFMGKRDTIRHYGSILMGLGMIFFGMSIMSNAMAPLREYQPFLDLMVTMENPLMGILVAAAFTGLVQSSSATTGIVIVMASQGFITLSAGIVLAFGSNVGTCVTALLAAIGKPREALRAAMVHVLFNLLGVLVWIAFIDQLATFVTWFSPQYQELSGLERLAAESPRQIANAHTVFNLANTVIFLGFSTQFARIVERLVPDRSIDQAAIVETQHIDRVLLDTPALALSRARYELGHMGMYLREMMGLTKETLLTGSREQLMSIARRDDKVDILYGHTIAFLGDVSLQELTKKQGPELMQLMEIANDMEHIGDLMETDLVSLGILRLERDIMVSEATSAVILNLHDLVGKTLSMAIDAVVLEDEALAGKVISMKKAINGAVDAALAHQAQRLVVDEPNRLEAYTLEMEAVEKLKRIYYYAKRIAKKAAPG